MAVVKPNKPTPLRAEMLRRADKAAKNDKKPSEETKNMLRTPVLRRQDIKIPYGYILSEDGKTLVKSRQYDG